MECIDCHTSREVMGDGYAHVSMDGQLEIRCEDCHGGALVSPRFIEVTRESDAPVRESRQYGRSITPGMRVALTNARIMIHQPSGGAQGMAADIEIQAREILRMRSRLNALYSKYTGQPIEAIEAAMDRDKFMEADEAKAFGIIDEVFDKRPEAGEGDTTGAADVTPQ